MAAHTWWRVVVTATNGDTYARIGELALKSVVGGTNLCTGGTIYKSTEFATSGDNSAAAAFDNNPATAWAGTTPAPAIGYNLTAAADIVQVVITARNDSFGPSGAPQSFNVEYSDNGTAWTLAWQIANQTAWTAGEVRAFVSPPPPPAGSHAWWRINVSANNGSTTAQFAELQFRQTAGTSVYPSGGTAAASSVYAAGYEADKLFDNNLTTTWSSNAAPPQWVNYHYGTPVLVVQVMMTALNNASFTNQTPKDFTVEFSDDGVTWTTLWSVTGQTAWGASEVRLFTQPAAGRTISASMPLPLGKLITMTRADAVRAVSATLPLRIGTAIAATHKVTVQATMPLALRLTGVAVAPHVVVSTMPVRLGMTAALVARHALGATIPLPLGFVSALSHTRILRGTMAVPIRSVATFLLIGARNATTRGARPFSGTGPQAGSQVPHPAGAAASRGGRPYSGTGPALPTSRTERP